MAAHITCHTTDILPNVFPPPKPTPKDHGMVSEYETPFIMHRSDSIPSEVTGGIDFDSDAFPILRKPIPLRSVATQESSSYPGYKSDPALCLTPEQPKKKAVSRQALKGGGRPDPKLNSKVRFEQTVEVKQLTPETSGEDVSLTGRKLPPSAPESPTYHLPGSGTNTSGDVSIETISACDDLANLTLDSEAKTFKYDTQDSIVYPKTEVKFVTMSTDPISVRAKDSLLLGGLDKLTAKGSTQSSDDSESAEELCQIMGESDHTLARPEFNSTLKFSKELKQLKSAQIDLHAAVEEKLKSSGKTREKISEAATSKVNTKWEKKQFTDLISVSVDEEEILKGDGMPFRATKPSAASKSPRPEGMIGDVPDIMDFFTMDLQKEAASYTLGGLPTLEEGPKITDPSRSFDIYRHIKAWEKL